MVVMIIRFVFFGCIVGAALTGSASYAAFSLLPAAVLLFTDGPQAILAYAAAAVVLLLALGTFAAVF